MELAGGAGAGIGGSGGNGAAGLNYGYGSKGCKGEDCGIINIANSLTIEAYGGSGGSGGGCTYISGNHQSGGGGRRISCSRNRPEVGAGGASGDTAWSGAGFTCGVPELNSASLGGVNGNTLDFSVVYCVGGSYYSSYASFSGAVDYQRYLFCYDNYSRAGRSYSTNVNQEESGGIGGGCCVPLYMHSGVNISSVISEYGWPDGGDAGKGGTIRVSENAVVRGYNGSYITTKDSSAMTTEERISTQALIYAQAGYDVKAIRELCEVKIVNARTISDLVSEWSATGSNYASYRTISSPYDDTCGTTLAGKYVLGIGSGAGSAQVTSGNGTYTIDSSLN